MTEQRPRIGSLFSGYGGLDMAVLEVLDADLAWYADVCRHNADGTVGHYEPHRAPCAILAHHHPDIPNLGDVAKVDWSAVTPVEILTAGFPCQDLSIGGNRAGLRPGTRSGLFAHLAYAIEQLQPALVVIENVRGILDAPAHSDVEPCPWCVGDGSDVCMRALGAVLGTLAGLGYDAEWGGLEASQVGAPHARFREFILAHRRGTDLAPYARRERHGGREDGRMVGRVGRDDAREAQEWERAREEPRDRTTPDLDWGPYGAAVERWAGVIGRPAPVPSSGVDKARRSPAFLEWMMGLPEGHVTGVPGLTDAEQVKAFGNGVVPQQAAAAVRLLLEGALTA